MISFQEAQNCIEQQIELNKYMNFFFCGNQKTFKLNYMSTEQASEFIKGLNDLITTYKADIQGSTDVFGQEVKGATKKFVDASHTYAQTTVARTDQLATDIQTLYQSIYGEGIETP
jgi:hypothetical protein